MLTTGERYLQDCADDYRNSQAAHSPSDGCVVARAVTTPMTAATTTESPAAAARPIRAPQAASSFTPPLRRQGDKGLPPPSGTTGLVAHHQYLRFLHGVAARQEHQPAEHPGHEHIDKAESMSAEHRPAGQRDMPVLARHTLLSITSENFVLSSSSAA